MSSRTNRVQELRFSETAGKRKKVDGLPPIMPQREENRAKSESQFDLRNSFAWDSAFFTSPGILDPEELFQALDGVKKSEHLNPETRAGECNDRRSLAWDNAFFTSAGILDPEELSMVNRSYRKSDARLLPGIDEDFLKSGESNSTISSEFSLASLEIDLFDHIKSSSEQKPRKESEVSAPASRKVESCSRRTEMAAARKQSVKTHGKEKIPKVEAPARKGESNSTIKRAFLGANSEKSEHKIPRKGASGQNVSKELPFVGDSALTPSPRSVSSAGSDKSSSKTLSNSLRRKTYSRIAAKSPSLSPLGSIDRSSGGLLASMNQIANDSKGISKGNGSSLHSSVSGSLKPSGLRMPLPKIGFFDMEKSALAPDSDLKFHTGAGAQTSSKGRNSIDRASNRGKSSKSQLPRTSMRNGRIKMSSSSLEMKSSCQKLTCNGKDAKIDCVQPDSKDNEERQQEERKQNPKQNEKLENNLHPVSGDGKENVCSFEKEVENLTQSIEAIDFSRDLVIEL